MKKRKKLRCPECERRTLREVVTDLEGSVRGERVQVNAEALTCDYCGFKTIPREKMGQFALRVADAYREKHGLLTSTGIKDHRMDLRMTQAQFANYLGVGVASVKRWELGQIQDAAMNNLMLLKADLRAAKANARELSWRLSANRPTNPTPPPFHSSVARWAETNWDNKDYRLSPRSGAPSEARAPRRTELIDERALATEYVA
jgi:putative zinc finger/helix-turn-helix YgiT family protein